MVCPGQVRLATLQFPAVGIRIIHQLFLALLKGRCGLVILLNGLIGFLLSGICVTQVICTLIKVRILVHRLKVILLGLNEQRVPEHTVSLAYERTVGTLRRYALHRHNQKQ